ncbi:MAG: YkgJ family cysteine cluster protein [Desulfobacterales bacterium]
MTIIKLTEKHKIYLDYKEALRAIRIDLGQYRSQPILLRRLAQLILSDNAAILQDKHGIGLWVATGGGKKFRLIQYKELPGYLCAILEDSYFPLETLAKICGCVFQQRAYPGSRSCEGQKEGIFVETGMEDFKCRQCGQCCRFLDYHNELTHEDYSRWQSLGRRDILERVGLIRKKGQIVAFRIWIDPVTHLLAKGCPWLTRDSEHNLYVCRIHDVRPKICRQYPGSRKHARMTGCLAFEA